MIFDVGARGQLDKHAEGIKKVGNHAATNCDYGGDMQQEIEEMEECQIVLPADFPNDATQVQKGMQTERTKLASKREEKLHTNHTKVFSLTHGQCADATKAKLHANDEGQQKKRECSVTKSLKLVSGFMHSHEGQKHPCLSMHCVKKKWHNMRQKDEMPNEEHLEKFKNLTNAVEQHGGSIRRDPTLAAMELQDLCPGTTMDSASPTQKEVAIKNAREKALAAAFVLGANRNKHHKLKTKLENDCVFG